MLLISKNQPSLLEFRHKLVNSQKPKKKRTHPTCGDDRVLENITAQLAAEFH